MSEMKKKSLLETIGEKKGYFLTWYANEAIQFSKTFDSMKERREYLEWACNIYIEKGRELVYFEDGIVKEQFLDPVRKYIEALNKMIEIEVEIEQNKNRKFLREIKLDFPDILECAMHYYEKYYLSGIEKSQKNALKRAISDGVTIEGNSVSYKQLTNNMDTAFAKGTICIVENNGIKKIVRTIELKKEEYRKL